MEEHSVVHRDKRPFVGECVSESENQSPTTVASATSENRDSTPPHITPLQDRVKKLCRDSSDCSDIVSDVSLVFIVRIVLARQFIEKLLVRLLLVALLVLLIHENNQWSSAFPMETFSANNNGDSPIFHPHFHNLLMTSRYLRLGFCHARLSSTARSMTEQTSQSN